ERAISRGTGAGDEGNLEEVLYEALGPGGMALMIEAVTDNRNRTSGNVKAILSKYGGALAGMGAVKWQFDRKGVIRVAREMLPSDREQFELELIDQGADDALWEEEGLTVYTAPEQLPALVTFLEGRSIAIQGAELEWIPKNVVEVSDEETRKNLDIIFEKLESDDDVTNYASNEA
ncbi:MAG: YebC/PmpR family DNA-binding transcriptional regulator, partial [bacterium]|nr:YebC/PmpR family DNA-binding transcriptional regulator [bacterium]